MNATVFNQSELEQDRQRERAARGAQVMQRFATTMCQREVRTRLVPAGIAPAWSTGNTITFVERDLGDLGTFEGVLSFKGLSLHEVAHILFTPRAGADIVRDVMAYKLGRAFNALEDQRIETLMVGRFGNPIVPWLTAVVAHHIAGNVQQLRTAYPLIAGREYLPVKLRRMARDLYANQEDIAELKSIIKEYRTLVFPDDTERALPLIQRYDELVKSLPEEGGCVKKSPEAYDSNDGGRPLKQKAQKAAKDKAEQREEEDDDDAEPFDFGDPSNDIEPQVDDESDSDENDGDPSDWDEYDGDEDTDEESEGDYDGDGDEFDDDDDDLEDGFDGDSDDDFTGSQPTDSDGDQQADNAPVSESETGKGGASDEFAESIINDVLNDVLDEVKERLEDEVLRDMASVNGDVELSSGNAATPRQAPTTTKSVNSDAAKASRSFGLELERLRSMYDPAWERQTKSGKVNASRFLREMDVDTAFDKWKTGREDVVDIEAVILLDISGSMSGSAILHANDSMWGIKRALDKVNASTTVVAFNTDASLVYSAQETAGQTVKYVESSGGTNPAVALRYARRVLAESDRAMKILFVITDGDWSGAEEAEETISLLRRGGVLTSLAYLQTFGGSGEVNHHNCELFTHITSAKDILFLGRQLVKLAIARNLTR